MLILIQSYFHLKNRIKTYTTEEFRALNLEKKPELVRMFKGRLKDFFCVKLEKMIPHAKTPIAPSKEECHTFLYVKEGDLTMEINNEQLTAGPNEVLMIQAGKVFAVQEMDLSIKGIACHFHPTMMIDEFGNEALSDKFDFLNSWCDSLVKFKPELVNTVDSLFARLESEYKREEDEINFEIIYAYLFALLTEIKQTIAIEKKQFKGTADLITKRAIEEIHKTIRKNLKAADIANILSVSPNHLNKSVKQTTGRSISKLIDEYKMAEIKFLLRDKALTILEVASALNFLDQSYFSRFFKKYEGITPMQYRVMIEKS